MFYCVVHSLVNIITCHWQKVNLSGSFLTCIKQQSFHNRSCTRPDLCHYHSLSLLHRFFLKTVFGWGKWVWRGGGLHKADWAPQNSRRSLENLIYFPHPKGFAPSLQTNSMPVDWWQVVLLIFFPFNMRHAGRFRGNRTQVLSTLFGHKGGPLGNWTSLPH